MAEPKELERSFYVLESRDLWESDPKWEYAFVGCFKTREEAEAAPIPDGEGRTVSEIKVRGSTLDLKAYGERQRTRDDINAWFEKHKGEI
mmetsp:Transcript_42436/g.131979  ORF Transcript_42436/g.131979 Transcript_42436/m.131979 type:complete len:90 (-) Transcript_42436:210-479(-)|eukprot:CAMPEP_0204606452 /NCGR_PEP_ID=MMETSP0661-20131031/59105_1 /ASSEMBLY_ACC=CAM_ASM_000606 /TAXON_ID=109239 /ORGANISM="Alexandrium margalefi, Strain AMGDE01CS-322" /LENGTH=89 /DNA_ID=CAMNT_0051617781 /DNA_START=82 /DNA_END=351 /DNA_ORIENTATION=-